MGGGASVVFAPERPRMGVPEIQIRRPWVYRSRGPCPPVPFMVPWPYLLVTPPRYYLLCPSPGIVGDPMAGGLVTPPDLADLEPWELRDYYAMQYLQLRFGQ